MDTWPGEHISRHTVMTGGNTSPRGDDSLLLFFLDSTFGLSVLHILNSVFLILIFLSIRRNVVVYGKINTSLNVR